MSCASLSRIHCRCCGRPPTTPSRALRGVGLLLSVLSHCCLLVRGEKMLSKRHLSRMHHFVTCDAGCPDFFRNHKIHTYLNICSKQRHTPVSAAKLMSEEPDFAKASSYVNHGHAVLVSSNCSIMTTAERSVPHGACSLANHLCSALLPFSVSDKQHLLLAFKGRNWKVSASSPLRRSWSATHSWTIWTPSKSLRPRASQQRLLFSDSSLKSNAA